MVLQLKFVVLSCLQTLACILLLLPSLLSNLALAAALGSFYMELATEGRRYGLESGSLLLPTCQDAGICKKGFLHGLWSGFLMEYRMQPGGTLSL